MGEGDHGHEDTVQHNLETCKQRHTRGIRVSQGGAKAKREEVGSFDLFWPFSFDLLAFPAPEVKPVSFLWHVLCIVPEKSSRPMMA